MDGARASVQNYDGDDDGKNPERQQRRHERGGGEKQREAIKAVGSVRGGTATATHPGGYASSFERVYLASHWLGKPQMEKKQEETGAGAGAETRERVRHRL